MPEIPKIETAESIYNDYWNMMESILQRINNLPLYEAQLLQEMMSDKMQKFITEHPDISDTLKQFI